MKNSVKVFGMIAMIFLALVGAIANVSAVQDPLPAFVNDVKINGDSLNQGQFTQTAFERAQTLDVKVQVETFGTTPINDLQITAFLTGSKDKVTDSSVPFTAQPNTIYTKSLSLKLPDRIPDREYQLRIVISSPNSNTVDGVYDYPLLVEAPQDSIAVKDIVLSPADKVLAGRAFTVTARLKNYGQTDEKDVKVVAEVPSLGISETSYINNIDKDQTVSSDEMLLRIPADTKSGNYNVDVTVYYNDGDDKVKSSSTINVVGDEQAAQATNSGSVSLTGKTTISVGVQSQSLARGENGVIFPLTLTNGAMSAKTYTLDVSGANDWATVRVSPSNVVVLNSGETKQVYVYVAANENTAVGEHVFSVDVKDGNNVVQQIPLKADVLESAKANGWDSVQKALTVGVVLLVILVVVLGIVTLYQRRTKGSANKEDEQIAQTYY